MKPAARRSSPRSKPAYFDLGIIGATAPGIVAAVRAAREGLHVALVTPGRLPGGSFPSLGALETHYRGARAPLLCEFRERILEHYRTSAGPSSEAFRVCSGASMLTFEPHVAERILETMLADESRIQIFRGLRPCSITRTGREIRSVRFCAVRRGRGLSIQAGAWMEAGDEGDFLALAGVRCRIGRESRAEFGEPRAGRVLTRWLSGIYPRAAAEGRLNLVTARGTTSEPLPGSSGEGDRELQSYSYRLCLTDDPGNRLIPEKAPANYDRSRYAPLLLDPAEKEKLELPFHHRFLIYSLQEMAALDHLFHGHALPNRKRSWNATNLTLLVVSTVSATHVAWGAVRQTPTLMHLAESAAFAVALARRCGCAPARVPLDRLQETLARAGVMLTFFNDMDMSPPLSDAVIAAQILGVHGFFEGWDARLEAPLARSMAQHWARRLATVRDVKSDGCNQKMDTYDGAVSRAEFSALLARAGVPLTGNIYNAEETGARTLSCGEAALWVRPFLYV